ncbi:MAG TPA: methyltransferase domain-containing protein [Gaiellaceae bacterium]|jgi:SAM-dependent methyltransferase
MWLRRLLISLSPAIELSVDTPAGVLWGELPADVVVQLHWPPTAQLQHDLKAAGFSTVALARHPLDVLLSILQFAQHEARTARWLNGAEGNEIELIAADPCSAAFRAYAASSRAQALLGVTPSWWASAQLDTHVRYEDLVASPETELVRVGSQLGLSTSAVDTAIAHNTLERLRAETASSHFWRGEPGLWRSLLPPAVAEEIAAHHASSFATCGYLLDPDPELTVDRARTNWLNLLASDAPRNGAALPPPSANGRLGFERKLRTSQPEALVESFYELALRRVADDAGRARSVERLERGELSPATLLEELVTSREARSRRLYDDAASFSRWARSAQERPRALTAPADASESIIALAWALARASTRGDVLDVGSAYADPAYLSALLELEADRIVCVDPAPVALADLELVCADVRDLPFGRESFDIALCLGTLQHVGCDNRPYGLAAEHDLNGALAALKELRRVLRGGGRLLVSVPCGEQQDLGLFVQRPPDTWRELFAAGGYDVFEFELYELTPEGWRWTPELPSGTRYGERGAGAGGLLCAELRSGQIRQAARRKVADATRGLRRR